MNIVGTWTLNHYWPNNGMYIATDIVFNSDGTFVCDAGKNAGKWAQYENMILLNFSDGPAIYGGNIVGNSMNGLMTTFDQTGCWYAVTEATRKDAKKPKLEFDVSGKKIIK
jgi:hypothetical protein